MESPSPEEIFTAAAATGKALDLPYAGALPPPAAYALTQANAACIVDVRTAAELAYVGRVAEAHAVEWQVFPDMSLNSNFLPQLQQLVSPDTPLLFLCRSGVRSHHAAAAAASAGYRAYNILEGFEGELDAHKHRNRINGWRAHGLPWMQS